MRISLFFIGIMIAGLDTSCVARSKIGHAIISDAEDTPCFAVPVDSDTRNGIPFEALTVTEKNENGATKPPKQVWFFRIMPSGSSIILRPENCIRYGVKPDLAQEDELKFLQNFKIYHVYLQVAPDASNREGYNAEFCILPGNEGKMRVQVIPWDETAGKWRYDVCART